MTIFEKYENMKRVENKLSFDFLCQFHDAHTDLTDILKVQTGLRKSKMLIDNYDKETKERIKVGKKICELSYLQDDDAKSILPKFMKAATYEEYKFKSLVIDDVKRVFLVKKGASLGETITMDNILTNENVIFLASTPYVRGFSLYQSDNDEIYSELRDNAYTKDSVILRDFIDGYICTKAERGEITLEDYYSIIHDSILECEYDEELLTSFDCEDAWVAYDREEDRRRKRIIADKHNKNKRAAINRIKAQRAIANLDIKYEREYKENCTFIRKLEIELGRRFSSLEKEIINSWLVLGYSEDIISVAYREAQTRGTYNISSIAELLKNLSTSEIKNKDNEEIQVQKNITLAKIWENDKNQEMQ